MNKTYWAENLSALAEFANANHLRPSDILISDGEGQRMIGGVIHYIRFMVWIDEDDSRLNLTRGVSV